MQNAFFFDFFLQNYLVNSKKSSTFAAAKVFDTNNKQYINKTDRFEIKVSKE